LAEAACAAAGYIRGEFDMSKAWQLLQSAVQQLAKSGTQRDRLANAITENMLLLRLKDLPFEIRKDFSKLLNGINWEQVVDKRLTVRERLDSINDAEIDLMIDSILDMYDSVTRYQPLKINEDKQLLINNRPPSRLLPALLLDLKAQKKKSEKRTRTANGNASVVPIASKKLPSPVRKATKIT
jgi:hypothetical protein